MTAPADRPPVDPYVVRQLLCVSHAHLDEVAFEALAVAIEPYLRRTKRPLNEAVSLIARHYEADGAQVQELRDDLNGAAWQTVLAHVLEFASKHHNFPRDTEATSWPDLDAYEDIREKLWSYNFEGVFSHWVVVTVKRRIGRYWRDKQALQAGGAGFRLSAKLADEVGEQVADDPPRSSQRVQHSSLDAQNDQGLPIIETLEAEQPTIAALVEDVVLWTAVRQEVQAFAAIRQDYSLFVLWCGFVERGLKLWELGVAYDLKVGQVHRRITLVRNHLRQSPNLRDWFDRPDV
ncbi:MAG: hypothetical protein H0X37_06505 [Herpetosiphonaceae bacterium]|nr:hypothetical protein [Herpetosiphonaceae bacterium]